MRSGRPRRTSGFTIVELLVVIAIVGVLMTLLVVAVQHARESARRTACSNHLRQIGLALNQYHTSHNVLPPAVIWSPAGEPLGDGELPIGVIDRVARYGKAKGDTIYGNWLMMLLPFLEQTSLHDSINFSLPISHADNAGARATDVAILKCPSDPYSSDDNHFMRGLAAALTTNAYARGNFALNAGPDGNCVQGITTIVEPCMNGFFVRGADLKKNNDQVWGSGMGGINKAFRLADASDGLSNTVVVDEIRAGLERADPRGVWALGQVGSSMTARHGVHDGTGGPNPSDPGKDEFIGCTMLTLWLGRDRLTDEGMACRPRSPTTERL